MPIRCKRCRAALSEIYIPYARLNLCPDCFLKFYTSKVKRTVEEFKMFRDDDVVGVAVSGGKDSMALLHALKYGFPKLSLKALHVNLGIANYSAHCQAKVEKLVESLDVELHIFDLQKEIGITIGDFKRTPFKDKLCSVCGTIKRHVFEELAIRAKVKVLATGHNLDDIVAIMFNNFLYGQWEQLVRLKPVLPPLAEGMAYKVKPLIKCPENENLLYCLYGNVPFREMECPFSSGTGVKKKARIIETAAGDNPYFKHQLLNRFLELIPLLERNKPQKSFKTCQICGFPSLDQICAYCKRLSLVWRAMGKA
ncbi:MAG: ATP-binding protein [Candidatus Bathyarchaeia archaeon]|nr:adenine nucleotide alpha hydrolase family protein [Candidatus Bathyarchaeota archaeon]